MGIGGSLALEGDRGFFADVVRGCFVTSAHFTLHTVWVSDHATTVEQSCIYFARNCRCTSDRTSNTSTLLSANLN